MDAQRFRGTCYRAANWIHVGQTQGRGRMDREQRAWPSKTFSFIHCLAMCNENFAATLLRIGHRNWAAVAKASSGVP